MRLTRRTLHRIGQTARANQLAVVQTGGGGAFPPSKRAERRAARAHAAIESIGSRTAEMLVSDVDALVPFRIERRHFDGVAVRASARLSVPASALNTWRARCRPELRDMGLGTLCVGHAGAFGERHWVRVTHGQEGRRAQREAGRDARVDPGRLRGRRRRDGGQPQDQRRVAARPRPRDRQGRRRRLEGVDHAGRARVAGGAPDDGGRGCWRDRRPDRARARRKGPPGHRRRRRGQGCPRGAGAPQPPRRQPAEGLAPRGDERRLLGRARVRGRPRPALRGPRRGAPGAGARARHAPTTPA